MKSLTTFLSGLGILGIVIGTLTFICLLFVPLGLTFYGIYLAFSANIILGVLVLVVEPTPLVLGVLAILGHPETAHKLAVWLGLS